MRNHSISADQGAYTRTYYNIITYGESYNKFEPSYAVISKIAETIFGGYQGVLIIYAILSIFPFFYLVSRYFQSNIYIILFYYSFFFFLHPMTQIRLSAAIPFLIFAIRNIYERKFIRFIIFVAIAYFFHQTSILILPFYFILNKSISIKTQLIIFVSSLVLSNILNLGHSLFSISHMLNFTILDKLSLHEQTLESGIGMRTASIYYIMAVVKILFNLFLQSKFKEPDNKFIFYLLRLHFYGYIIYILCSDIHLVSARVSEMFGMVEVFFVPLLMLKLFKQKKIGEYAIIGLSFFQLMISLYWIKLVKDYSVFFL